MKARINLEQGINRTADKILSSARSFDRAFNQRINTTINNLRNLPENFFNNLQMIANYLSGDIWNNMSRGNIYLNTRKSNQAHPFSQVEQQRAHIRQVGYGVVEITQSDAPKKRGNWQNAWDKVWKENVGQFLITGILNDRTQQNSSTSTLQKLRDKLYEDTETIASSYPTERSQEDRLTMALLKQSSEPRITTLKDILGQLRDKNPLKRINELIASIPKDN